MTIQPKFPLNAISITLGQLPPIQFDAIVIGSGYGGSVAALRLAEAGRKVCLLERGREVRPGEYPTTLSDVKNQTRVSTAQTGQIQPDNNGMMDLRIGDDMNVILGNGLGGGSLINANVAMRPDPRVFKSGWPAIYGTDGALDPWFAKAKAKLFASPLPASFTPSKLLALGISAGKLGYEMVRPDIAVTFADRTNDSGIRQAACTQCGDCCAGCNYGAKNTLLMNYLPEAFARGAVLVTQAEVDYIKPVSGSAYAISVRDRSPNPNVPVLTLKTGCVVLAAGALGSTEILNRSAVQGLQLVTKNLGRRFSGNGDILGFGMGANVIHSTDPNLPPPALFSIGAGDNAPADDATMPGPCITGMVRVNMDEDDPLSRALVVEDGVAPGALSLVYPAMFFLDDAVTSNFLEFPDVQQRMADLQNLGTRVQSMSGLSDLCYAGPLTRMQSYLVMSHDAGDGSLAFDPLHGQVSVSWPGIGQRAPYPQDNEVLRHMAGAIWADYLPNPMWSEAFGYKLVTVHPIGGCVMSDDPADGVVDGDCLLYTGSGKGVHATFLVCDGAVIPGSLGINPLLTITAVAERAMDRLIAAQGWKVTTAPLPVQNHANTPPAPVAATAPTVGSIGKILAALVGTELTCQSIAGAIKADPGGGWKGVMKAGLDTLIAQFAPAGLKVVLTARADAACSTANSTDCQQAFTAIAADCAPLIKAIASSNNEAAQWKALAAAVKALVGTVAPTLSFSETMSGWVGPAARKSGEVLSSSYELGEIAGRSKGMSLQAKVSVFGLSAIAPTDRLGGVEGAKDGQFTGTLTIAENPPMPISNGRFRLLRQDGDHVETWVMKYTGFIGADFAFTGRKFLRHGAASGSNWWTDLTTLYVDLNPLPAAGAKTALTGIIRLGVQDIVAEGPTIISAYGTEHGLATAEMLIDRLGSGTLAPAIGDEQVRNRIAQAVMGWLALDGDATIKDAIAGLEFSYEGVVAGLFGQLVLRTHAPLPSYLSDFPAASDTSQTLPGAWNNWMPNRKKSNPPGWAAQTFALPNQSDPTAPPNVVLYRFNGAPAGGKAKGPVILAPGFGTTVLSFAMLTNESNIVEMLLEQGFDIWLFDNRSSPLAPIDATRPFDLDDIVREDWPQAVAAVLQETGAKDVQILAHCIGALTAQMALLCGAIGDGAGLPVRSLIVSQLTVHPATNWFNLLKSDVHVGSTLANGRLKPLQKLLSGTGMAGLPDEFFDPLPFVDSVSLKSDPAAQTTGDPTSAQTANNEWNLLAWYAPFGADQPCLSPTCHRIFGIFGPSFLHSNLNEATHNGLREVFGKISTKPFEQIGRIVSTGHAVGPGGVESYMPNVERLKLPIHFIAGALNLEFLPDSSLHTLLWLRTALSGDAALFSRTLYQGYGHMDFFIGKNAHEDIFPDLIAELAKYN